VAFLELSLGKGSRAWPPHQPSGLNVVGGSSSVSKGKVLIDGLAERPLWRRC
jgi:hypothetical protein